MPIAFDVAVIGGGAAGSAAAIAAAQSGARVCIVTGAPGATALFSGAWRGACPDPLRSELARSGYELLPNSQLLPHPAGTLVACDLAAKAHVEARPGEDALVVGIAGLPGFEAAALALQWSAAGGARLGAMTITLSGTPSAGWAPASLAAALERSAEILTRPLAEAVQRAGTRRVILPAILGVHATRAVHQRVQDAIGCPVGEALGVPPSLPGWRLHGALRQALERAGVTSFETLVRGAEAEGDRIHGIQLAAAEPLTASAFVLATGKFLAGGIETNGGFREPVFGCPVWVDHLGERFAAVEPLILTDPDRNEDQPLLRAGLHTDAAHRPVNTAGDVVFSNVLVAGSIRAGWSIATHAVGDAAADGWTAGTLAVHA